MSRASVPPPIQALLPEELAEVSGIDLASARRVASLVHKGGGLPARSPATLRRAALEAARARTRMPALRAAIRRESALDPFVKYALELEDGAVIETVRIPLDKPGRVSVCVSSQVGCALACAFCATGRLGLRRNLEAWEIVEQVRHVRAELPAGTRVHGVVFQGMGEPLANLDRVVRAVRVFSEPSAQAIDRRNITVCTAGLPAAIRRLTRELPEVRLGVSIGDARSRRRGALMPIDETHDLDEVIEACGEHARASGHAPMWAYTLLAGSNDGEDAASALASRVSAFAARFGIRPRLSLVPYNAVDGAPFSTPSRADVDRFRAALFRAGAPSIVRYSGGSDIAAACGQLAPPQPPTAGSRAGSNAAQELA